MKNETQLKLKTNVMDEQDVHRTLKRMAEEIIEKNDGVYDCYLIGIKSRGIPLAQLLKKYIDESEKCDIKLAELDINLYRDDLSEVASAPVVTENPFPFSVNAKKLILVDDVLYTGRTVRSALEAIFKQGRPASVQLAVLVDRGHKELPIYADYVGKVIPTSTSEIISVKIPPYNEYTAVEIMERDI